ncbi:MAG TPA: DNA-3-methyladenine glycosylase 2 family protein [Candidatus Paceibacterota bacterium]
MRRKPQKQDDAFSAYEREAYAHFKKADPVLHKAALPFRGKYAMRPDPKKRNDQLFAALAASVVGQQLSMRAADTIWERVKTACGGKVTARTIATTSSPKLRKAGLSAAKVKTLKSLTNAVLKEKLNLLSLRTLTYKEAAARLTQIWGIGPWTVEMFLIFALGNRDIFSPGDLALARATERLYGLPKNTPRIELSRIAEGWSPHRSFACLVFWKLYEG